MGVYRKQPFEVLLAGLNSIAWAYIIRLLNYTVGADIIRPRALYKRSANSNEKFQFYRMPVFPDFSNTMKQIFQPAVKKTVDSGLFM